MIFNENRLLADDSHEISYLIFFENLSSAAVVIGALRVKKTIEYDNLKKCKKYDTNIFTKLTVDVLWLQPNLLKL